MKTQIIQNETQTSAFGRRLGAEAQPGQILALTGDLGTGKTTLTKYIAQGLDIAEPIISPTFTILREYHSGRLPLYHFDLYRIDQPEDLYELGFEEYLFGQGFTVIEWADKAADLLPETAHFIQITHGKQEGERIYRCTF